MECKMNFAEICLTAICHHIVCKVYYKPHETKLFKKFESSIIDIRVLNRKSDYVLRVLLLHGNVKVNQTVLQSQKV
jgi:hypothetical protein